MSYRNILNRILQVFNLSDNAKQIFLILYTAEESNVGQIIKKLKMDRSSAYLAVEQLKAAGLIEIDESKRPWSIRSVEPRQILGRIETKIQNLEEVFDTAHSNLSQLSSSYGVSGSRPIMQSFNSRDGLHHIMEDILATADQEIFLFTNQEAEAAVFSKHDHNYFIRKRRQQNLSIKVIATSDELARNLQSTDKQNLRITKVIDGPPPFSCEVYIYANKIAMLSFRDEVIGFIINSPDYADLLKWQFNRIWESL